MKVLRAALVYFALVFGAGFVLGPIRVVWLVPALGVRTAELLEMPVMLVVVVVAARWVVRRFAATEARTTCAIGGLALLALLAAEFGLAFALQGLGPLESVRSRDPVSGAAFAGMLLLFAAMPTVVRRSAERP